MTPVVKACKDIATILKRNITKNEKELEKVKVNIQENEKISIKIKDLEISNESDLQLMFGYGELTTKEYERALERLHEVQDKNNNDWNNEYYAAIIKILKNILSNVEYTMEYEEKRYKNE